MKEIPEPLDTNSQSTQLPPDGSKVRAKTLPSLEYDTEAQDIEGVLSTIGSPFSPIPNCWVSGKEVDPESVTLIEDGEGVGEGADSSQEGAALPYEG